MPLNHLFDRNVAWAHRKTLEDPTFFARLAEQQTPKLLWIGCSDSRVAANVILDVDPGQVFVHRNVANMVHTTDMNLLAVIEFAVEVLKVEHIIVCGHYRCGGVTRALGSERSALVDHWLQPLVMMYRKHRSVFDSWPNEQARINRACELNVEMQLRRVASVPIVERAWARRQPLHLHGWIYGIQDGLLRGLGPSIGSLAQRDALPTIDQQAIQPNEPMSGIRLQAIEAFSTTARAAEPAACCGHAANERPEDRHVDGRPDASDRATRD